MINETRTMIPDFLIGREKVFAKVANLLAQPLPTTILLLTGQGGFGKTRLVHEFHANFKKLSDIANRPVFCFPPIDFDDINNSLAFVLMDNLASQVEAVFVEYREARKKFDYAESMRAAPTVLMEEIENCKQTFKNGIKQLTSKGAVVVLMDTFEIVRDTPLPDELWNLFSDLPGLLVVIAGRELNSLKKILSKRLGRKRVVLQELLPFTLKETGAYFRRSGTLLNAKLLKKLFHLTDGHPILVALTEYWMERDLQLVDIVNMPDKELFGLKDEELKKQRAEFKELLVHKFLDLTLEDDAILRMACLHRRTNPELLACALQIGKNEAQALIESMRRHPFIKLRPRGEYALHDELRRMLLDYDWPILDPAPECNLRRELWQRVIAEYYDPQIEKLKDEIHTILSARHIASQLSDAEDERVLTWQMESDRLFYLLQVDSRQGWDYFVDQFEKSISRGESQRCQLLINTLTSKDLELILDQEQKISLELKKMRLQFLWHPEDKEHLLKELNAFQLDPDINADLRLDALSTLAWRTDDRKESLHLRQVCVEIAQGLGKPWVLARQYNNLGIAFRRAGDWSQAIEEYDNAAKLAARIGNPNILADALSFQAYIWRLRGDTNQAEIQCWEALILRTQRAPNQHELASSYQILGEILNDMRQTAIAMEYFQDAASLFQSLDMKDKLVKSWISIANIHRQQFHLDEARVLLDKAIDIARTQEDNENLAAAYGELGCGLRREAHRLQNKQPNHPEAVVKLKEGRQYLEKALNYAEKTNDPYREADALIDLALLELYAFQATNQSELAIRVNEYIQKSYDLAKNNQFLLWESRSLEMWGNLALAQGKLKTAFVAYYLPASRLVADVPSERFRDLIDRVVGVIASLTQYSPPSDQELLYELDEIEAALEQDKGEGLEKIRRTIRMVKKTVAWRINEIH